MKSKKSSIDISVTEQKNGFVDVYVGPEDCETYISIRSPHAMYIHIGDKIVYIDYSTEELIIRKWASKK
jgi:hypothetical protein